VGQDAHYAVEPDDQIGQDAHMGILPIWAYAKIVYVQDAHEHIPLGILSRIGGKTAMFLVVNNFTIM